jgi:hypothetical protein
MAPGLRHARHDRPEVPPHRVHDGLRAVDVACETPEAEDLSVRLLQVLRRLLEHDLDPELAQL